MATITVEFEEIPSVIINGLDAGFVEGAVEVEFDRSGWHIESVSLDMWGKRGGATRTPVSATDNAALLFHLIETIEDRYARKIESDIDEYRESAREAAAEARAEMRRDERMWG